MKQPLSATSAETIGLQAVAFLAARQDDLARFLNLSGVDPGTLRERVGEAEFLAAVLDFLLADDALLAAFCEAQSLDARTLHVTRHRLPGG